jgi:Flp pilus assembly protein TadD
MKKNNRTIRANPHRVATAGLLAMPVVAIILAIILWRLSARSHDIQAGISAPAATYVGEVRCAQCHAAETDLWRRSHHALAMKEANATIVLGDFNDAVFSLKGVTSSMYQKDQKYFVRTDGRDGTLQDFPIQYTFGVYPLQQYLVPFAGGRLQSLVLAWDSRDRPQGGQRWFHLYPDHPMPHTDPLHWTRQNQTWNYMCAACHSTNLRAGYELASDSYKTAWSEINVSCEACHGPGSRHVAWAESAQAHHYKKGDRQNGLVVDLISPDGSWTLVDSDDSTLHWKGRARSNIEVETCAPCHSRRRPITMEYQPGQHFLDAFVPVLLDQDIYHADGQILEEDYEYGSFLQSKMYREGVKCSDCHNPHSGKLKQPALNQTCDACHSPARFDTAAHHHHEPDTAGAQCVNCHMPARTYMVVDVRRDHSFRLPRPDLSVKFGPPNACNQCHQDRTAAWAVDAVSKWFGPALAQEKHFVEAINAGRRGSLEAEGLLSSLILDSREPAIARATALGLLRDYLSPASMAAVQAGLADSDALVRAAAVRALEPLQAEEKVRLGAPLLDDSITSVRIEAARLLAGTPPDALRRTQSAALDRAISELVASEMATAERPESHLNLALLYAQLGRTRDAENELKISLRLDPDFVPGMVNLADLYRAEGRESDAQQFLERAMAVAPSAAEPIHALGLLEAREKQYGEALGLLAKAAALKPANVRYSFVYAVALGSSGKRDQAIAVLEEAHNRRPADRDVLMGLVTFQRDRGDFKSALAYCQQLVHLSPSDAQAKTLLADLLKLQ